MLASLELLAIDLAAGEALLEDAQGCHTTVVGMVPRRLSPSSRQEQNPDDLSA